MSQPESAQLRPKPCPAWGTITAASLLAKTAQNRADAIFLAASDGLTYTFSQANHRVETLARFLRAEGFGPGDTLLLRAGRRAEGLIALIGAVRAGMDVCVVPEGMSARQATDGAVSYAPKIAIDAGDLTATNSDDLRIMEMAASLFTIRMVGCFGSSPDGLIDFSQLDEDSLGEAALATQDPHVLAQVHMLHHDGEGKLVRLSRTQGQLLTQGLACAMASGLTPSGGLGCAYDPVGAHGLLAGALPALIVGATLQLFDPLDKLLEARMSGWANDQRNRRLVLPFAVCGRTGWAQEAGQTQWIAAGQRAALIPQGDSLLMDCAGAALVPAEQTSEGLPFLRPGHIIVTPERGQAMSFGSLRLEGGAQNNSSAASLMSGEIYLSSPLVAARNGRLAEAQPTGQLARLGEDDARRPVYVLSDGDGGALRVGSAMVVLASVNRALGLTGRWQDAAVFAIPDAILGHRIEVAVEPRFGDKEAKTLPTLDLVRAMLRESGVGDAGLPIRLHLVTRVPRRGRGVVDVATLSDYLIGKDHSSESTAASTPRRRAVA